MGFITNEVGFGQTCKHSKEFLEYCRPRFPLNEALAIFDAFLSTILDSMDQMPRAVLWELEEAIEYDSLDAKWCFNKEAFLSKLRGLSDIQYLSLIDAIQEVKDNPNSLVLEDALIETGLVDK